MISINDSEEILKKEYNIDNFVYLTKEILLPDFENDIHPVAFNNAVFSRVTCLGESKLCDLTVFEVILKQDVQNQRVTITQEMFRILRGLCVNNAVVAFATADGRNYRISLLTSKYEYDGNKIVKVVSNPRRYSYSLGFGTKTKTAYKFLIAKGKVANLDELITRFSVEVVNKQFYSEVAAGFTQLVGGKRDGKEYEKLLNLYSVVDQNKYAEFAVRLIGRIMFCWFLKEKKSEKGISLIPEDMLLLSNDCESNNYYHNVLEPLFFELLNTNQNRRRDKFGKEEIYKKIPYLNGGLFSPHADDLYKYSSSTQSGAYGVVTIPNAWFKTFYEVLGQYNFTVDENTSYDIELSIDPEMLGRIFENLLAEINPETGENAKKSTGSFYTPRDIVDYMVDSSLLEYLKQKTELSEPRLKALITYGREDDELAILDINEKKKIINAIFSMTVLDPACGSGAFPIGMLQKIVYILQEIDPDASLWFDKATENVGIFIKKEFEKKFNAGSLNYIRKLSVIQNSIFGIDIQPIAVEIARLRCFLSLVIEEKVNDEEYNRGINPLPNLDFKFIIANSLMELDNEAQISLFENQEHIAELKAVREEYFNADSERRTELKLEFADIQKKMYQETISNYTKIASTKYQQLSDWSPFKNEATSWFDPEWMFGIKDGFDIIIANPPYVDYRKIENFESRNKYKVSKTSKMINLYVYFFEMGLNMLKKGGILTFISPQQYLVLANTKGLRDILRQYTVISLSDFSYAKVFDAGTYPFVTVIKKILSTLKLRCLQFNQISNMDNYSKEQYLENPIPEPVIISLYLELMKKIEKSKLTINDVSSNIFVASSSTQNKLLVGQYMFLEASDIFEHEIRNTRSYINFTQNYSLNSKNAQLNDVIYISRMTNRIRAVFVRDNKNYLGGKVNVIVPKQNKGILIVALLNSKLVNFWFKERFAMTHMQGGAFPINAEDIKIIPIPLTNCIIENELIAITKKLYSPSIDEDTRTLILNDVDNLVYRLYGLTEEEIAIVEEK